MKHFQKGSPQKGVFRLSKNLYNEKGRPPYPYQSAKSRDLCVAFCTSQGRGAPLVRCPDGHTFFAFLRTTGPARERSMGAEALRQPLAKTRKSGLSHFFDTLREPRKPNGFRGSLLPDREWAIGALGRVDGKGMERMDGLLLQGVPGFQVLECLIDLPEGQGSTSSRWWPGRSAVTGKAAIRCTDAAKV